MMGVLFPPLPPSRAQSSLVDLLCDSRTNGCFRLAFALPQRFDIHTILPPSFCPCFTSFTVGLASTVVCKQTKREDLVSAPMGLFARKCTKSVVASVPRHRLDLSKRCCTAELGESSFARQLLQRRLPSGRYAKVNNSPGQDLM